MKFSFRAKGRVQGVGYRVFVLRQAHSLALAGWVRNELDGAVSGAAGGDPEQLASFRAALRKGPPNASLEALDWEALDEGQSLPFPFEIRS